MHKIKSESGVSLLEVMISILVLTLGILGLAPLIGIAIYNNTYSNEVTLANAIAQGEVEMLLSQSNYGMLPFISTVDSVDGIYSLSRKVEDDASNITVPPGVYKISVNLQWTDMENQVRNVYYSALKPKK